MWRVMLAENWLNFPACSISESSRQACTFERKSLPNGLSLVLALLGVCGSLAVPAATATGGATSFFTAGSALLSILGGAGGGGGGIFDASCTLGNRQLENRSTFFNTLPAFTLYYGRSFLHLQLELLEFLSVTAHWEKWRQKMLRFFVFLQMYTDLNNIHHVSVFCPR